MSLVRKRIVLPLIPTDIFQVIRPTQNKDAVLDLTYQQLLSALSDVFSEGGSLILLKTNGTDNPNQNILNLVAGTGVTLDVNDQGDVTINSFGGSFITSITDTATIDLDVTSGVLTGNLVDIGTAGTYGSGTQVPQVTIDSKGRVTSVSLVNITAGTGTVTSVGVIAGTGINATISGTSTINPTINITNTAPDVVVGIAGGATIGVSGFYPNFTLRTNVSTPQRLLGRFTAGAGAYEEITISTGLSLSGSGVLTATGTTTPYTANNGLTESPANNFQLGGTLVQNTNLTNSSFYLRFTQSAGKALELYSNDAEALLAQRANNSRNTVDTVARLVRRSTTNPLGIWTQSGFGAALDFDLMMSNGATVTAGSIAAKWNSPISPSESSNLTFSTRNAGTLAIQMGLSSTGQLTLDKYTGSTFDGTATKALGVDASGNVITFTSSPVSGDSISPFLLMGG